MQQIVQKAICPGVIQQYMPGASFVLYIGDAASLVAAGMVRDHQLSGRPDNGIASATYNPDGPRASRDRVPTIGRKTIYLRHAGSQPVYHVREVIGEERVLELVSAAEAERQRVTNCWPFPVSSRG